MFVGWSSFLCFKCYFLCLGLAALSEVFLIYVETADGSDEEEDEADGYYEAKASKKKEKKRQEREAQRRVHHYHLILYLFI